jgi:uncharacterized membrane protein
MKPLAVLIVSFIVSLFLVKIFTGIWNFNLSGNIAMSIMLVFTAIGHFVYVKGMTMMIPNFIPFKTELVLLTGLFELIIPVGLLIHSLQREATLFLMVFFVLIIPANIHASLKKVNYQKASYTGSGTGYLWFRIPLQIFFILWIYYFNK